MQVASAERSAELLSLRDVWCRRCADVPHLCAYSSGWVSCACAQPCLRLRSARLRVGRVGAWEVPVEVGGPLALLAGRCGCPLRRFNSRESVRGAGAPALVWAAAGSPPGLATAHHGHSSYPPVRWDRRTMSQSRHRTSLGVTGCRKEIAKGRDNVARMSRDVARMSRCRGVSRKIVRVHKASTVTST